MMLKKHYSSSPLSSLIKLKAQGKNLKSASLKKKNQDFTILS